jgi:glucokinase
MILAGDIGGTSTRLGLFNGDPRVPGALEIYPSREHSSLEEMIAKFLRAHPAKLDAAAFGIAGPVRNGRCVDTTNLAWPVDASAVGDVAGVDAPILLNDLEANAWGLQVLGPDDLVALNEGDPEAVGNIAVVSAGTGLGLAGLYWDGERHRPFASEGGHIDFAPRNELQTGLWRYLQSEYGHVSYERVCSGMGLVNVYRYLRDTTSSDDTDLDAPAINRAALDGSDPTCSWALDVMISIYGAQAGNTALSLMATGGVYLGGGMPTRILPRLLEGGFIRALLDKGRFRPLMERIPVHVILNDKTALLGAARAAAEGL